MIYENLEQLIGNTPVLKHNGVYVKLEGYNPGGSIKDRIALNMITSMLKNNEIKLTDTICEPTSGNTGIGIAMVCAYLKMRCVIVMPENMSEERIKAIKAYNAEIILTDKKDGIKGAIAYANKLAQEKGYIVLDQFSNKYNPLAHEKTALEIVKDFKHIDYFVAGIGTGGTISGVAKVLKEHFKDIKIVGVEPEESPIITKNIAGPHKIQGIGTGFIPKTLNLSLVDEVMRIKSDDALSKVNSLASEGLFLGISSACNILASEEILRQNPGKVVVTISPDSGLKYLSVINV